MNKVTPEGGKVITTANEMGGIRPEINLRKKNQLLATMQRRRKKIGKMRHKECIGKRVSTDCLIFASGSSMLFKSKQFECAMLLICYIASLKGGDKLKEEARIFLFFLLLCGDVFKIDKIC